MLCVNLLAERPSHPSMRKISCVSYLRAFTPTPLKQKEWPSLTRFGPHYAVSDPDKAEGE